MEWSEGVPSAIEQSRMHSTPLLVLVEPPLSVQQAPAQGAPESAANLYARLATTALHAQVFCNPTVSALVTRARLRCLHFPAETAHADYVSFSAFFKILQPTPNLFLISPASGLVLYHLQGYVSPLTFLKAVCDAVKTVSGVHLELPRLAPQPVAEKLPSLPSKPHTKITRSSVHPQHAPSSRPAAKSVQPSRSRPSATATTSKSLKLPSSSQPKAEAHLRARLPNGRQLDRVFVSNTPFATVRAWVCEEMQMAASKLLISTAFPRYSFSPADDAKQLAELDLVPSATLVVAALAPTGPDAGATFGATARVSSLATGVFSVFRGFFNSFVAAPAEPVAESPDNRNNDNAQRRPPSDDSPPALRMTGQPREGSTNEDGHLVSNGNSTQFGWRPDEDEVER